MDRVFFIHIPKAGGMTVEHILTEHFMRKGRRHWLVGGSIGRPIDQRDVVCPHYYQHEFMRDTGDLSRYRVFMGHNPYYVSYILPRPLTILTCLRDPLRRALSVYNHLLRELEHVLHERFCKEVRSFGGFLTHPEFRHHACEAQIEMLGTQVDFARLTQEIRSGRLSEKEARLACLKVRRSARTAGDLKRAKARLQNMPALLILDHFEQTLRQMKKRLRVHIPKQIPRINSHPNAVKISDLDRKEMKLAKELNPYDYALYHFGLELCGVGPKPLKA